MGILDELIEAFLSTEENYLDDSQSLNEMEKDIQKDNDNDKSPISS